MKLFKRSKSYTRTNRKISRWEATVALIAVSFLGMAITATAQAPASKRTVIRAGRVLNVRTGELRANQALVIEGDKISQIAPSTDVNAAAGDTTIDLPDATLLPGLIDMHTHLTFELSSLSYEGLKISTAREALHGARNARRTLEAGFTPGATSARKTTRTMRCATRLTMATGFGPPSGPPEQNRRTHGLTPSPSKTRKASSS